MVSFENMSASNRPEQEPFWALYLYKSEGRSFFQKTVLIRLLVLHVLFLTLCQKNLMLLFQVENGTCGYSNNQSFIWIFLRGEAKLQTRCGFS